MMTKWEYSQLKIKEYDEGLLWSRFGKFSDMGKEGWELVSVDDGIAYFKREIKPEIPALKDVRINFPYRKDKEGI